MSKNLIPLYKLVLVKEETSPLYGKSKLDTSKEVYKLLQPLMVGIPHEEFLSVHLDAKHHPIGWVRVSVGSLTLAIVHPREVFKAACIANSAAIILAHNHPSGDPTPSQEDRLLTTRLKQCGELLGIPVLDHLIFGETSYVSFADEGWL